MPRSTHDQRPLLEPWFAWERLPDDVREHALDVLTALYFETAHKHNLESKTDDNSSDH
jgi:hypothetical protein